MAEVSAPAPNAAKFSDEIQLAEGIVRGSETISSIKLRKFKAGELRGLSVQDLMNARVSAVLDVLPRITVPIITQAEADNLEAEDIAACGGAIIGFFLSPADRERVEKVLNG